MPKLIAQDFSISSTLKKLNIDQSVLSVIDAVSGQELSNASLQITDEQGKGYFMYAGKKYDGVSFTIPVKSLKKLSYVPAKSAASVDPSSLKMLQGVEIQQSFYKPDRGEWTETVRADVRENPYDPIVQANLNPGISEQINIAPVLGASVGDNQTLKWTSTANWQPEIVAEDRTFLAPQVGQKIPVKGIVFRDIDADAPTYYLIEDLNPSAASGYFMVDGKRRQGQKMRLTPKQFAKLTYVPGQEGTSDSFALQASDGVALSTNKVVTWQTAPDRPPVARHEPIAVIFTKQQIGQPLAIATDLKYTMTWDDPDGDAIEAYSFMDQSDDPDSGYFLVGKQRQKSNALFTVPAADLSKVFYVPGKISTAELIGIGVKAGGLQSEINAGSVWGTESNDPPLVINNSLIVSPEEALKSFSIAPYISAYDQDGDAIQSLTLKDASSDASTGFFEFKGQRYQGQSLTVPYNDLGLVSYVTSLAGVGEKISVSAFDGYTQGAETTTFWRTQKTVDNYTKKVSLWFNEAWEGGDFLGLPNERSFDYFLGPNLSMGDKSINPNVSIAGVEGGIRAGTGNNKFKAGLQLQGGYGLGRFALFGGVSADIVYNSKTGISLGSTTALAPQLELELPYAYLNVAAVADIAFKPYLEIYWRPYTVLAKAALDQGSTGNLLGFLNFSVNKTYSLVDFDTRDSLPASVRPFRLGALSSELRVPSFGSVQKVTTPAAITSHGKWASARGEGVSYGYEGASTIFDLNLSLAKVATAFGIPLTAEFKFGGGDLSGSLGATLLDILVGAKSDLSFKGSVSMRPNITLKVEGSNQSYDLVSGLSIGSNQFADLNGDRQISVRVEADPIIGAYASAKIESSVNATIEALKAWASIDLWKFDKTWQFGPLFGPETVSLGSLGDIPLFEASKVVALSEIAPSAQSRLNTTFSIPLVA